MKLIDTTEKLMKPEEANRVAAEMNASDPDWKYTAVHDPKGTGYSFVKIEDEDGNFVGKV
jgi:hypothetical protein